MNHQPDDTHLDDLLVNTDLTGVEPPAPTPARAPAPIRPPAQTAFTPPALPDTVTPHDPGQNPALDPAPAPAPQSPEAAPTSPALPVRAAAPSAAGQGGAAYVFLAYAYAPDGTQSLIGALHPTAAAALQACQQDARATLDPAVHTPEQLQAGYPTAELRRPDGDSAVIAVHDPGLSGLNSYLVVAVRDPRAGAHRVIERHARLLLAALDTQALTPETPAHSDRAGLRAALDLLGTLRDDDFPTP
jgi:hypothetical protein